MLDTEILDYLVKPDNDKKGENSIYTNLPIFRDSLKLNLYVEDMVRKFSRFNKYEIGSELRENSREVKI